MRIENSYIICSLPRAGSTLLGAALARTGKAGNPQEFFKRESLVTWKCRLDLPPDTPLDQCVLKVADFTRSSNGLFGQKVMWDHLENLLTGLKDSSLDQQNPLLHELIPVFFPETKMIFLHRENRLKQAISYFKAMQSGIWHNNRGAQKKESGLRFDYYEIKALIARIEKQEHCWQDFFKAGNFNYFRVSYEELVANFEEYMIRIFEFLGLQSHNLPSLDNLGYFPTRSEINDKWESKYLELDKRVDEFDRSERKKILPDNGFQTEITSEKSDLRVHKYEIFPLKVWVKNTSKCRWNSVGSANLNYWIRLQCVWQDERNNIITTLKATLPNGDCMPGETAYFKLLLQAPGTTGNYSIKLDMIQDGVAAFSERGSRSLILPVRVGLNDQQSKIAEYFGEIQELSQYTIYSPWLGTMVIFRFPAVYHNTHGWLYCYDDGAKTDSFWFKTEGMGHLWTSREKYPLMWSDEKKVWLEYVRNSRTPPIYLNPETGERFSGIRGEFDF